MSGKSVSGRRQSAFLVLSRSAPQPSKKSPLRFIISATHVSNFVVSVFLLSTFYFLLFLSSVVRSPWSVVSVLLSTLCFFFDPSSVISAFLGP